jgi:asparagine synthase (glutamine-hydrolysing)
MPQLNFDGFPFRRDSIARAQSMGFDPVATLSLLDQRNYLVSILNRQDKMSMAASIESRVPFLDYRIVEFSNRMPSAWKMRHLRNKVVLKKVAENFLPQEIISRKKSGFGVPLGQWFRDLKGLGGYVEALLSDGDLDIYVRRDQLEQFSRMHRSKLYDYSDFLWSLINLKIWKETFRV